MASKRKNSRNRKISSRNKKNRVVAGVLAILLGDLGIHKFYLGKSTVGLLYLAFCWTGIPAVVGLIEGVLYLCTDDKTFKSRYC